MYRIRVSLIIITCIVTIILAVLVDRKGNVYMGCLTSNHAIPRSYVYFFFFFFFNLVGKGVEYVSMDGYDCLVYEN